MLKQINLNQVFVCLRYHLEIRVSSQQSAAAAYWLASGAWITPAPVLSTFPPTVFILYLDDIYNLSPDVRCSCLMKLKIWTHQHQGNWAESSLSALAFHSCPGNKETPSIIIRRLSHIFKLPENPFNHETPKKASFKDSYQRQLNTVHALICCNSFPFTCRLLISSGKIY